MQVLCNTAQSCFDQCGSLSKGPPVNELEPPVAAAYATTTTAAEQTHSAVLLRNIDGEKSVYLKQWWILFWVFQETLNGLLKES